MSVGLAVITLQIAWFLLGRDTRHHHYSARLLGYLALAYVVTNAARLVAHAVLPQDSNDFFLSNKLVDSLSQLSYITVTSLLTLALALMVNQRLLADFHAQENTFAKTFDSAPYGILLTRLRDHPVIEVNREFERMSGWRREEMLGKTPAELHLWNTVDDQKNFLSAVAEKRPVRNLELEFRRKDGSPFIGVLSTEVVEIGGEPCLISSVGDVTEQHRLADQLRMLASHDALTKLPNRRLFYDRFAMALANAQRNLGMLAVLSVDLDNFKEINDTCGHDGGDTVLVEAAHRLTQALRAIDTVARFGGDEFVILLWEVSSTSDASEVALKLLEQFQAPFATWNAAPTLHASVGIALYPDQGDDLETLLRKSDEALYAVKRHGKNNFKFA
jgi:diguanylate cyclase (GGDEF)-like protein/PAS domain S-box-containing protein